MKQIFDFLKEVRVELGKVVWPSANDTIKLTVIVVLVTIAVGFFLGVIDFILVKLLGSVINK